MLQTPTSTAAELDEGPGGPAKFTHLVDLSVIPQHLQVVSTLSTFFAVVEKEGLRELVESDVNQLKR